MSTANVIPPEIPGLILEAETPEGILEEAQRLIPELLRLREEAF